MDFDEDFPSPMAVDRGTTKKVLGDVGQQPTKKVAKKKATKSASETYQRLSQLEHILKRPDSYIGSTEAQEQEMWVWDEASSAFAQKTIKFVPGLLKIFDEILGETWGRHGVLQ